MEGWSLLDTWMVLTGAAAAMSCAVPGMWLVLRRQSLLGDALSHSVLPGIVMGALWVAWAKQQGWLSTADEGWWWRVVLSAGALVTGMVSGGLAEWLHEQTRIDRSAALGVVATSFFALGLVLLRAWADQLHLDATCVLYGNLETAIVWQVPVWGWWIPGTLLEHLVILLLNLGVSVLLWKEWVLTSFDPSAAQTQGLPVARLQTLLVVLTAVTVITAFESVGTILVIAMLIVPAATARLLSDRVAGVLGWSLLLASLSAMIGYGGGVALGPLLQQMWQLEEPADLSLAGMMAVVSGGLYLMGWFLAPKHGLLVRGWSRSRYRSEELQQDLLAWMFRVEEAAGVPGQTQSVESLARALKLKPAVVHHLTAQLERQLWLAREGLAWRLTPAGRAIAQQLVRSHRLWETYLARHYALKDRSLHSAAEWAEHVLTSEQRQQMARELEQPEQDPHGRTIPKESSSPTFPAC
ncbi:MAG: manganese ABC transporter permease [Planctomycetaceae bacterium]|nr:MAG: manganese ABC transporter permease [Planctomycetaceae bacterium]